MPFQSFASLMAGALLWIIMPGAFLFAGKPTAPDAPIQVLILAGQSNMEGQGVVDLDDPRNYNGGRGTLLQVMRDPLQSKRYAHVRDDQGRWAVREDVWCRFQTENGLKKGGLTIGFTGYGGQHHIGPEYQFGQILGNALDTPVLLIKTAWGGKSLYKDFRPPSSGGKTGPSYQKMIAEVREALENLGQDFPALKDRPYELAGFVWFQGWNDAYGPEEARSEYEQNLVNLIHDVRKEFDRPDLPVVIGETGNGGEQVDERLLAIRKSQSAVAAREEFQGRVIFVKTTGFARPAQDSPNTGHGHHWYGNAESYFLIGEALGKAMLELLSPQE